jgi:hypothetical protein
MIEQCSFKARRIKGAELICTIARIAPNLDIVKSSLEIFNAQCVLEENCVLYQTYRNSAISQLPVTGNRVARCPVCDGRGTLPYGFYHDQPRDTTGAGPTTQCRSCMGRGIVMEAGIHE